MKLNKKKNINQHDLHIGIQRNESNIDMPNSHKKGQTLPLIKRRGPIATSTKQMAGYFTVSGIQNEISLEEKDWACFTLKELLDNGYDWLNDYYPISSFDRAKRSIYTRIQIDQIPKDPHLTRIFRITVRNSNVDKVEAFTAERLKQIFDYTQWLSTKRNQHRMTAGSLGDYLKRHAGMAYASWNNIVHDNSNSIDDDEYSDDDNIQWEEPITFRFNGKQYNVFVYYDRYSGLAPESVIKYAGKSDAIDYTEVECTLPVSRINWSGNDSNPPLFDKLLQYYTWYKIPKADIKFSLDMQYDIRHTTEEDD